MSLIFSYFLEPKNFVKHLDPDKVIELGNLLSIDRNRTVERRILPSHYHEKEVLCNSIQIYFYWIFMWVFHTLVFIRNLIFEQVKSGLDPNLIKLYARITPLLDVSDQCRRESVYYLKNLIDNENHPLWAIKSKYLKQSLAYCILYFYTYTFSVFMANILNKYF